MGANGKPKGGGKVSKRVNTIKFFQDNIVDGKSITQCSKESGLSRTTLHAYKNSGDFRQMAITHLEDSNLGGLKGVMSKLVKALDAKRPVVTENKDGSTSVKMVKDMKTQMTALQEVNKIYGLYAPIQKNVTVGISISSDEDLFGQIDTAQRACKHVDSYEKRESGFELASGSQGSDKGDIESRGRTVLQGDAIPKPE